MSPFAATASGASVRVRVTPRAGRSSLTGVRDDVLLVRLAAPPVEGAANEALVELVSRTFGVPRRAVTIAAGERSRTKRVEILGAGADSLNTRLAGLLGG